MKLPDGVILDSDQLRVVKILEQLNVGLSNPRSMSLSEKISHLLNRKETTRVKGIYIHGSVGRGKTMLMDAFFNDLKIDRKERWHFHAFMQLVHERLKNIRQDGSTGSEDQPIILLAKEMSKRVKLLCFDEFHVSDIADAMILGRLFSKLFEYGVVVVATSNQHPDELYKNGLHRDRFLPFINLLKLYTPEVELDGPIDYRRQYLQRHKRYFTPLTQEIRKQMHNLFEELSGGHKSSPVQIENKGRVINFPKVSNGMALTSFEHLCHQSLGSSDYLALADNFHTLFLEDVPVMREDMHNEVKRFTTLIDILYDREINLVVSAEAHPDELYKSGKNSESFKRTVSRLIEMTGG